MVGDEPRPYKIASGLYAPRNDMGNGRGFSVIVIANEVKQSRSAQDRLRVAISLRSGGVYPRLKRRASR